MFYILTYATHEEGYFSVLKRYEGIIVLGMGTKWSGLIDKIKGVVEYCKTLNPEDTVLFVDGFDSVILKDKETIISKYSTTFSNKLVFSNNFKVNNIMRKYAMHKIFGTCKDKVLNSGMYIGPAKKIIDFWKGMTSKMDDQVYANSECRKGYPDLEIDSDNILFYNYSSKDKLIIDSINTPCVISAPGGRSMNELLSKLGVSDLPDIKFNWRYRLKTYLHLFVPELVLLLIIFLIIKFNKSNIYSWIIILLVVLEFIHYQLYVKFYDRSVLLKFIYCLLDFIHMGIMFFIFISLFNYNCDISQLLITNVIMSVFLIQFFIFKRCSLTLLDNKILGRSENTSYMTLLDRLKYFFDLNTVYKPNDTNNNIIGWINGNIITFVLLLVLNCYCFVKLIRKHNRSHS
jgi:hypothetical protein